MGITVNGTIIPENVASALSINGVNITQVIANSISVWNQSLFKTNWSGSSLAVGSNGVSCSFDTSGNLFRAGVAYSYTLSYTPWCSTQNGVFTGGTVTVASSSVSDGLIANGSNIFKFGYHPFGGDPFATGHFSNVTYNSSTNSFSSVPNNTMLFYLQSTGGLFRMNGGSNFNNVTGAYITLA